MTGIFGRCEVPVVQHSDFLALSVGLVHNVREAYISVVYTAAGPREVMACRDELRSSCPQDRWDNLHNETSNRTFRNSALVRFSEGLNFSMPVERSTRCPSMVAVCVVPSLRYNLLVLGLTPSTSLIVLAERSS